jgi:integrase
MPAPKYPKVMLTDAALKALKPPETGWSFVRDAGLTGHRVRITSKGGISFLVVRRRPGDVQPLQWVFGSYKIARGNKPVLTLAEARAKASELLRKISEGVHPRDVELTKRRAEQERRANTFTTVAEDFIKRHVSTLRSAADTEAAIRREMLGQKRHNGKWAVDPEKKLHWRDKPVTDIKRRDAIELIESIVDRGSKSSARLALAHASKLFRWAVARDAYNLDTSPFFGISAKDVISGLSGPRTRVLTDDELRWIWRAANLAGDPFGSLVKVLMLTGQRLAEISDASWHEIDDGMLIVPAERMKGKVTHAVPLTPLVCDILSRLPRFETGDYIFTTMAGERPFSGFGKSKDRLDAAIAKLRAEARGGKGATIQKGDWLPKWVLHDLRRTVRTRLSSLTMPLIAELILSHVQQGGQGLRPAPIYG